MDFGAIIGFIAIAFISSLFNKNKQVAKPTNRPNIPPNTQRNVKRVDSNPNQRYNTKPANTNRHKPFKGGLGDIFNELKNEFEKNFGDVQNTQTSYTQHEKIESEKKPSRGYNNEKTSRSNQRPESRANKDSVYAGEIGKNEFPIEFDRKSIIQGIIMSEVLQKPKSLRK